jgi:hypothetical protein
VVGIHLIEIPYWWKKDVQKLKGLIPETLLIEE